jgi:hypothetical protein
LFTTITSAEVSLVEYKPPDLSLTFYGKAKETVEKPRTGVHQLAGAVLPEI